MNRTLVAMSGGVDSSVAAALLVKQGYDCMGVTMKLFHNEEIDIPKEHTCCSLSDVEDAKSVAYLLGIPYHVFNFSDRFREEVIDRFVNAYCHAMTPNPCIDCNRYLKFDKLFLRAKELRCNYVATGHYARVEYDGATGRYLLKKALDQEKDQSYVLYCLNQEQLAHTQFPLGELQKSQVRKIAEEYAFVNARKKESQDICFVPDGDYARFIEQYTGKKYPEGSFIDRDGKVLGTHRGIIRYTVGQRKGLGLSMGKPMYVCSVNAADNTVTLGSEHDLYSTTVTANNINLIATDRLDTARLKAKIRYRQEEQWATVTQTGPDKLEITFDTPQRAVTGGQAVVLYDGELVIGGGTIQ